MLFLGSAAPGNRCRAEKGPVIFCFVQRGNLTAYMWERRNKGKNQEGAGDVQCQRTENIHEKVNRKLCRRSPSRERRKVHGRPKFIQRHQTTHQLHCNHYLASNSKQDVKKKPSLVAQRLRLCTSYAGRTGLGTQIPCAGQRGQKVNKLNRM